MVKKFLLIATVFLFVISSVSIGLAETVNKDPKTVDQFTTYQDGKATDLNDNKDIPENVKKRIKELSDTKPETKGGTVLPKVVRPSVNHQK